MQLLDAVNWGGVGGLAIYLGISSSTYIDISKRVTDETQLKMALLEWYLDSHPAPSWKHVADALYRYGEHDILDILRSQYLKGEFASQCLKPHPPIC
jgi:hypothetical protein